jgi:hypothetical protein
LTVTSLVLDRPTTDGALTLSRTSADVPASSSNGANPGKVMQPQPALTPVTCIGVVPLLVRWIAASISSVAVTRPRSSSGGDTVIAPVAAAVPRVSTRIGSLIGGPSCNINVTETVLLWPAFFGAVIRSPTSTAERGASVCGSKPRMVVQPQLPLARVTSSGSSSVLISHTVASTTSPGCRDPKWRSSGARMVAAVLAVRARTVRTISNCGSCRFIVGLLGAQGSRAR